MKATVAGLVTPHLLKVVDLARQEETGANVDWHVREAVSKTIDELAHQYNARDLLSAYTQGLANAAEEARRARKWHARVLRAAATQAARELERRAIEPA